MPETYALARRVLLDALEVLEPHLNVLTLVGAQAVYLRVGEADVAVAPTTTDGDLALDPETLMDTPALEGLLRAAGFERKESERGKPLVGIWTKAADAALVSVDLLMPESLATPVGRRAARLVGHDTGAVLKVPGIEASLVDADLMRVDAIDPSDQRSFDLNVAGPAALLVAKVHKILDRTNQTGRLNDKDALDVFRLLRGVDPQDIVARLRTVVEDPRSRLASQAAMAALPELSAREDGTGIAMAVRATAGLLAKDEVVQSMIVLSRDLLEAYAAASLTKHGTQS